MENTDIYISDISASDIKVAEDFLEHHGIIGMKWGKKNGPPYPLDDSISTGKRLKEDKAKAKKKAKQAKAAAKRLKKYRKDQAKLAKVKAKIAKDPKKLMQNTDKFTTEEINAALEKFQNKERVKNYVNTPDPKPVKLSMVKRHMARDEKSLYKNRAEFTPEEMDLALEKIYKDQAAKRARTESQKIQYENAKNALDLVNDVTRTVGNLTTAGTNIVNLKKAKVGLKSEKIKLEGEQDRRKTEALGNKLNRMDYQHKIDNFDELKNMEMNNLKYQMQKNRWESTKAQYESEKTRWHAEDAKNAVDRNQQNHVWDLNVKKADYKSKMSDVYRKESINKLFDNLDTKHNAGKRMSNYDKLLYYTLSGGKPNWNYNGKQKKK